MIPLNRPLNAGQSITGPSTRESSITRPSTAGPDAGSSLRTALSDPTLAPLVLDGGLSTELERRGHDLSGTLWSARLLRDAPQAVVDVHAAFLRAGAQVITTASYQATPEGFSRAGFDPDVSAALLTRSVELAQRARDLVAAERSEPLDVWIAGSVGPYGAMLADGSEYTGDYGDDVGLRRLREFHRPRLELLRSAGVDVLALETVPSVLEAEALVTELAALDHPGWLSLTTTVGQDGVVRTRRGEPAEEAFALAADSDQVLAVGVNCTEPNGLAAAIEVAAMASGKPVVAYPNSGEGWDAVARSWTGTDAIDFTGFDQVETAAWIAAGARIVGGCCRVGPETIAGLAQQLAARP